MFGLLAVAAWMQIDLADYLSRAVGKPADPLPRHEGDAA